MPTLPPPSFSRSQKWRIGLQVLLVSLTVLAVVFMVNYLSRDFSLRFHLSSQTGVELAPRTVNFVRSITNNIKVVVYYDKSDALFSTITELLNEYREANPKIKVHVVDYLRDPAAALKVKAEYRLGATTDKNLVIFDCEGRFKIIDGKALADYATEQVQGETEPRFRSRPVTFKGELTFTSILLAVTNPKPLKAFFLTGHGEHPTDSADESNGYLKFASVLQQNYVQVEILSLLGTNTVPLDCHLLVIAGPTTPIPGPVLEKIDQYLEQGGRLLALFKFESSRRELGLERILARWGVEVGTNIVRDPENTLSGSDVIVGSFARHPVVNPLARESRLHLVLPRSVGKLKTAVQTTESPGIQELAFSGPKSFVGNDPLRRQPYPLLAAVEKGGLKGVVTERGTTRMIIAGDSIFLANHQIESAGNRDFAGYAVNWLLDRPQLLKGVGPKPMTEYRLAMTRRQLQRAQLLLLAAMPGTILCLGGLVWLRRRY
jgi:hypothetical protein